jgi:hypothetical protein
MLDAPHFDNVDHALNSLYTVTDSPAQPIRSRRGLADSQAVGWPPTENET